MALVITIKVYNCESLKYLVSNNHVHNQIRAVSFSCPITFLSKFVFCAHHHHQYVAWRK